MPKCTSEKANGEPCRAWAVRGTDPALCAAHGGAAARIGAPRGNKNAEKHGAYSSEGGPALDLRDRIGRLDRRLLRLDAFIDRMEERGDLSVDELFKLYELHARMTARLGRLVAIQHKMEPGESSELLRAIDAALAEVGPKLGPGIDLVGTG